MDLDKATEEKIEEIQNVERNLQAILMQKQTIQVEVNEASNAVEEVKKSKEEVYKVIGNIMLRSSPEEILKELEEKKKLLNLRLGAIEKQEKILETKAEKLKEEINRAVTQKPKEKS